MHNESAPRFPLSLVPDEKKKKVTTELSRTPSGPSKIESKFFSTFLSANWKEIPWKFVQIREIREMNLINLRKKYLKYESEGDAEAGKNVFDK